MAEIFVTGGTGFVGRRLIRALLDRGHRVRALVRAGSEERLPEGSVAVTGNALDAATFREQVAPARVFVHLVGAAHPSPWKEKEFRRIDLASLKASVEAAKAAGIEQFVFVSVAMPAPVMKAYIRVRQECEEILRESGIPATILRPWYVLGPGRRWPELLKPIYALLESMKSTRETALRLAMVEIEEMVTALVLASEHPAVEGWREIDAQAIRRLRRARRLKAKAAGG
ncbi:MAG: NAD(P)H-binding protein [Bryobacteraceae bacterium]|nr:NAD(P)H-binding protein [Bryobacteraceae bacterium]